MPTTARMLQPSPDRVWAIVSGGSHSDLRVVGATQRRQVAGQCHVAGVKLHRSAGVWSLVLDDSTEITAKDPDRSVKCVTKAGPSENQKWSSRSLPKGRAHAWTALGALKRSGQCLLAPVYHLMIKWLDVEAVHRFANVIEGRR